MLNRFLLCVLFCSVFVVSTFALQGEDTPGSRTFTEKDAQKLYKSLDEENKMKWDMIESRKQDLTIGLFSPIVFYGKVVDQNGDPVPQTKISVITEVFTPNPLTLFTTKARTRFSSDSDGFFHYNGVGRMITVYIWPPDGYEHTDYSSSRDFYYGQTYGEKEKKIHHPDKNNPVIFKLRKKAPAVLSFRFMQHLRGMKPDKDYYGDMFYHESSMQSMELSELPDIDPEHYYPQVKVHQTYRKESENTHIFSLDVEFLGDFQIQKGEWNPLVVPESGYTGKSFHVVYKIVPPPESWKDYKDYILSDENKWIPNQDPSFSLYVKTKNNYYGIVELFWSPHQYLNRACTELSINYRFNSVPGQRVFEDDSALRRELDRRDKKNLQKKTQDEFFSGVKSLSEILGNENSENGKFCPKKINDAVLDIKMMQENEQVTAGERIRIREKAFEVIEKEIKNLFDSIKSTSDVTLLKDLLDDDNSFLLCLDLIISEQMTLDDAMSESMTNYIVQNGSTTSVSAYINRLLLSDRKKNLYVESAQAFIADHILDRKLKFYAYFILQDSKKRFLKNSLQMQSRKMLTGNRSKSTHALPFISTILLASDGDKKAIDILDQILDSIDIDNNFDLFYLIVGSAITQQQKLIDKICFILKNDDRMKFFGFDCDPQYGTVRQEAAASLSLIDAHFPSTSFFSEMSPEHIRICLAWIKNNKIDLRAAKTELLNKISKTRLGNL